MNKTHTGKKPLKSHPWKQFHPGWLKRTEPAARGPVPMIGGIHSKQGKCPC